MPSADSRKPRRFRELIHSWVPFGLGETKPHHFREMARIVWENRARLGYAYKLLTRGVCDGCALGTTGLSDWTIDGTHLCMVRLELLKLNTMAAGDPRRLRDTAALTRLSSAELRDLGRLAYPMRRRRGEPGFTRVSWDEAWRDIGARWRPLDPKRTAMYLTSRGITNEVYYTAQKVMRFLGSNNVDNSARLCHSPSTTALKSTVGVGATTCSYRDWFDADLIVFFGSNPANDQPVALKYLHEARRRGARVVMVNPYREPGMERYWIPSSPDSALFGTRLTDRFILVKVGGDLAFLNAVQKILIAKGWIKPDFIAQATEGYEALVRALDAQPLDELAARAGVDLAQIEAFASELAAADRGILVWSMGITQHAHGARTVKAIVNLGLLREYVGRPGTGLMPIRGHSGVQGGAEMGAYATALPGGVAIDAASAARFRDLWGFDVPEQPGLPTVDVLEAAGRGEIDGLYCIGGNFLETMPSPARIEAALGRIGLRIHSDIVVTTQMLVEPADSVYLLPARTRYEQVGGGTETSTERRVIFSPYIPGKAPGESRSEWESLLAFARAVDPDRYARIHMASAAEIRADIARAVPAYAPIASLARQGDQFQIGGAMLCTHRTFPTPDGRAHFQAVSPPGFDAHEGAHGPDRSGSGLRVGHAPGSMPRPPHSPASAAESAKGGDSPALRIMLCTRRGKQFNSMVQRHLDPLTGAERDHLFVSKADADRLGVRTGDALVLRSVAGEFHGRAFVADVAPGTMQGHWPEVSGLLSPGVVEPEGGVPDYNAEVSVTALRSSGVPAGASQGPSSSRSPA